VSDDVEDRVGQAWARADVDGPWLIVEGRDATSSEARWRLIALDEPTRSRWINEVQLVMEMFGWRRLS